MALMIYRQKLINMGFLQTNNTKYFYKLKINNLIIYN